MDKYWQDYIAMRPGTLGGDRALSEQQLNLNAGQPIRVLNPSDASNEKAAATPRAPRMPYRFKGSDFVVAVVVFLATWLVLWHSSSMGGGTAAAAGFFASCLAARWWRQLLFLIVIGLGLAVYFHSR